ncbi:hypothetical protein AAGT95_03530 [Salinicola lusitanus]|uniref:Uncharacterized protein n=1 Tax=Salinicola lusitanus TaxID=1949085 RepID=A0ABZ3CV48_9GAMM
MGLKNWLWNDNARKLFHARDAAGDDAAKSSPGPRGQDRAKKLAKGSAAFSSALLFGTNESQGLLRTLGESSKHSDGNHDRPAFAPPEANLNDSRTNTYFGDYYDSFGVEIED